MIFMMSAFFMKRRIQKHLRRIEKYGEIPEDLKAVADAYAQAAETASAIAFYQRAIEAYYCEGARVGKENAFIFETCHRLLAIDPLNALAYQTLGQEYCGVNAFETASRLYQAFAKKLVDAERYEDAIAQYRNVLVFEPDHFGMRERILSLLLKLRKRTEAAHEFQKLAELAEKMGRSGKAVEYYKNALQLMPSQTEAHAALRRLTKQNRMSEAPLRLVVNQ